MNRLALAAVLLTSVGGWTAAPLVAETLRVEPGEGAGERLQEALILAAPGELHAAMLTVIGGRSDPCG